MSKDQVKQIIKKYKKTLEELNFPVQAIYIFGSQTKGTTNKWSDIDVAVVSDKLKRNRDKYRWQLWNARMNIDLRIEPHGFTVKEFQDNTNPLAYEIRKTGIRIQ